MIPTPPLKRPDGPAWTAAEEAAFDIAIMQAVEAGRRFEDRPPVDEAPDRSVEDAEIEQAGT